MRILNAVILSIIIVACPVESPESFIPHTEINEHTSQSETMTSILLTEKQLDTTIEHPNLATEKSSSSQYWVEELYNFTINPQYSTSIAEVSTSKANYSVDGLASVINDAEEYRNEQQYSTSKREYSSPTEYSTQASEFTTLKNMFSESGTNSLSKAENNATTIKYHMGSEDSIALKRNFTPLTEHPIPATEKTSSLQYSMEELHNFTINTEYLTSILDDSSKAYYSVNGLARAINDAEEYRNELQYSGSEREYSSPMEHSTQASEFSTFKNMLSENGTSPLIIAENNATTIRYYMGPADSITSKQNFTPMIEHSNLPTGKSASLQYWMKELYNFTINPQYSTSIEVISKSKTNYPVSGLASVFNDAVEYRNELQYSTSEMEYSRPIEQSTQASELLPFKNMLSENGTTILSTAENNATTIKYHVGSADSIALKRNFTPVVERNMTEMQHATQFFHPLTIKLEDRVPATTYSLGSVQDREVFETKLPGELKANALEAEHMLPEIKDANNIKYSVISNPEQIINTYINSMTPAQESNFIQTIQPMPLIFDNDIGKIQSPYKRSLPIIEQTSNATDHVIFDGDHLMIRTDYSTREKEYGYESQNSSIFGIREIENTKSTFKETTEESFGITESTLKTSQRGHKTTGIDHEETKAEFETSEKEFEMTTIKSETSAIPIYPQKRRLKYAFHYSSEEDNPSFNNFFHSFPFKHNERSLFNFSEIVSNSSLFNSSKQSKEKSSDFSSEHLLRQIKSPVLLTEKSLSLAEPTLQRTNYPKISIEKSSNSSIKLVLQRMMSPSLSTEMSSNSFSGLSLHRIKFPNFSTEMSSRDSAELISRQTQNIGTPKSASGTLLSWTPGSSSNYTNLDIFGRLAESLKTNDSFLRELNTSGSNANMSSTITDSSKTELLPKVNGKSPGDEAISCGEGDEDCNKCKDISNHCHYNFSLQKCIYSTATHEGEKYECATRWYPINDHASFFITIVTVIIVSALVGGYILYKKRKGKKIRKPSQTARGRQHVRDAIDLIRAKWSKKKELLDKVNGIRVRYDLLDDKDEIEN